MKVGIKNFPVTMDIKTKGIELDVYSSDGKSHLGDLVVTKTGLTWCRGKTMPANGQRISWEEFIAVMAER